MDIFKLRLKIGVNEFEAEGSQEYIEGERQIFLESIAAEENSGEEADQEEKLGKTPPASGNGGGQPAALDASGGLAESLPIPLTDMAKLAVQDNDLMKLTALPQDAETQKQDALLLLLLAHKLVRGVDNVKATDALNGMKQSGIAVSEVSGLVDKMPTLVLKTGIRKGTKYRLSVTGTRKAIAVATTLLTHVR